jgi:hypothetical protein
MQQGFREGEPGLKPVAHLSLETAMLETIDCRL